MPEPFYRNEDGTLDDIGLWDDVISQEEHDAILEMRKAAGLKKRNAIPRPEDEQ